MKNLSLIPRLSLFEAFTILITLAVCLAGFTEAEVRSKLRKQAEENYVLKEASMRENVPYSDKRMKLRGGEVEEGNAENSNGFAGGPLEKLMKRQSDDFGESSDSEGEKENDGYGYDDDEYYHLNYKRNEEAVGNLENNKMSKESIGEMNKKEGVASLGQKLSNGKGQKENEKELQTIEMLNFKEFHPHIGANENPNQNQAQNPKPFAYENTHKKLPASSVESLNMRDLKENSAIDEKMKDRKDESTGVLAGGSSESKVAESKKGIKTSEEKDAVKLKETKISEESEKKEKEASLKDVKENVGSKNLKENAKGSEEKEKNLKLSENAKLEENLEKLNAKNKESETAKIAKEDKESSRLSEKGSVDVINPNDISQISNRASFVSSDYKDSLEAIKQTAGEDDEKNSEDNEMGESEKNVGLSDYEDSRGREEKLRERQLSLQESDLGNDQELRGEVAQDAMKRSDYLTFPVTFEMKDEGENDYFKKRESWKDHSKFHMTPEQMQQQMQEQQQIQQQSQQQQQQQEQMGYENDIKNSYHLKFPPGELENTEYHKNFIKSLKRYKGLSENTKSLTPESTSYSSVDKTTCQEPQGSRKKKHSKPKKRRSMVSGEKEKGDNSKSRRNAFRNEDRSRWYGTERQSSQTSSSLKTGKDDPKLKKYNEQQENPRQRRKSPGKLEYEIKIINQNQQESKNAPLSSLRSKKDLKTKLATDDKYLKKYPYSQVSRDDLTKLGEREPEKKFKRKAPVWMRKDQSKESIIQTRGLPSGYYGNRVKFGQKNYARTEDKSNSGEQSASELNKISFVPMPMEKSSFQRTWELKSPDYKHDPMKRYDSTGLSNHASNSLLLIKKGQNGERIAKTFEEGNSNEVEKADTERLVKLLSKDTDYLILKKTEANKYRKVVEPETGQSEVSGVSYQERKSSGETEPQGKQSAKNKGVYTRSSHKEDKKYSSGLHQGGAKSNLKKTFEKFRDLADFFKDNEQESADAQFPTQEVKEGRDIVFSEDKLPDPIVINSDGNSKADSFGQKPTNSIYSISTNFKHLDQQDRKEDSPKDSDPNKNMLTAEAKSDSQEFSWEPALKNAFPEAKTINSMSKNGNEIIVLDFNRNQLKNEHGYFPVGKAAPKSQPMGSGERWLPGSRLLNSVGQRQVEVVLPSKLTLFEKGRREEEKLAMSRPNGAYAVFSGLDGQTQVTIPLNQLAQLPGLFRTLSEKMQNSAVGNGKSMTKKSPKWGPQNMDNYNQFLRDLQELSEINKKGKLSGKRNVKEIVLPGSSFPELTTYGDVNIRKLGNLLQNIMSKQNAGLKGVKQGSVEGSMSGYSKAYEKSDQWYPGGYETRREGQWSASEMKTAQSGNRKEEAVPAEVKEEMDNVLRNGAGRNSYEEELWEELSGAKVERKAQRLRRDGERKERKGGECPSDGSEKCMMKLGSEMSDPREEEVGAGEVQSGRRSATSRVREEEEGKESLEERESLKSEYEGHLNELFEKLSSDKSGKDQINIPNESGGKRGKRKEIDRRKRSSRRDVKNKVSTTEVQNRILKNFPEDNYPSVYSPGIKRRLLSTGNEAEDADGNKGADEHERSEMAEGGEANCAKKGRNKCIDPMILELFEAEGGAEEREEEEERSRDRRSLRSGFHSNFKREIDLDESMPNDFQNFLVTSLGGFGSQKREVVKKEEALWEGKENGEESYNEMAETSAGGKETSEDSALEKREVSSGEKHSGQKYKSGNYFGSGKESDPSLTEPLNAVSHSEKVVRSEEKSPMGSKASEYEDKVPTQIRIQITNAGVKEKKSSKSIMDDSESTSTEMENLPKEKEFFDKNKINPLGVSNLPKLHQFAKPKFSFLDYEDCDSSDASKQKAFTQRQYRRRRRKKKKYVPENPMKPVKDFIAFDQKAMEILLRKYMADQNLANEPHTTQKVPMSNHLPQVETVYNPTQGTNKAQLETNRLTKINSMNNKNAENSKSSLQTNEACGFNEDILRSYLKDKSSKTKSEKNYGKEYEEVNWKPYSGKTRLRTDTPLGPSFQNFKSFGGDVAASGTHSSNLPSSRFFNPYSQNPYNQKWIPAPYSNYFYHPPNTNIMNSNSFYDALKLKQELKNYGLSKSIMMKDHVPAKSAQKPYYYSDGSLYNKADDKEGTPNFGTTAEPTWNNYDYNFNKKSFNQNLKTHDFYNPPLKAQLDTRNKNAFPNTRAKFIKSIEDEKLFDNTQARPIDAPKYPDYLDVLEDDYADDDTTKDLQFDEPIITDIIKKSNKLYDPANFHHLYNYKPSDVDDGIPDTDEDFDDEYDETTDDDDLDDYSLLANTRDMDPELTKSSHSTATLQGTFRPEDTLSHLTTFYPRSNQFELKGNSFEQTEYTNPKSEESFEQSRQSMPLVDLKNDLDPLTGSSTILRKANENSNIFGKNLMKNLNKYSYDESWRNPKKLQDDKPLVDLYPKYGRKLRKRKMEWQRNKLKRSQEYPQIGNRLFYVSKMQMPGKTEASSSAGKVKFTSRRHDQGDAPQRMSLTAQFADGEDEEEESESENKRNGIRGVEEQQCECEDEKMNEVEEVQENLEDDGETISEDNVLENVIGKYIMRKRVQSPSESRRSGVVERDKKVEKRSVDGYLEGSRKMLEKRLSSGHLTENNYKKFHKKAGKRHVGSEEKKKKQTERREKAGGESERQRKRSALELLRKMTNKEKEGKKPDSTEARNAGFEPLLTLTGQKAEVPRKDPEEESRILDEKKVESQEKTESKLEVKNEPVDVKEGLSERKKEKSKVYLKADGPWKLELEEKFDAKEDRPEKDRNSMGGEAEVGRKEEENKDLKAYFVISKNVRRAKRKLLRALPPTSGSSQTEVGTSYRPTGIYKTHVRKRSLDPSSAHTKTSPQDPARASLKEPITETYLPIHQQNRALHDTQSLSEKAPHVRHRNPNKNRSFVTDDEQNPRFLSKGKLTKSVFPPSSQANIFRDSRDISEGRSEYLGEQIVEAILSHVSANPKFKDLIAPGLVRRTSAHRDTNEDKRRALHQMDFTEQLQTFLQKFLFDLEKLAAKHMQKRMCGQIDRQSKDFLQSLLNVPAGRSENAFDGTDVPSSPDDVTESSTTATTLQLTASSPPPPQEESPTNPQVVNNLKKKQYILRKLIDEYQSLSKLQQETLDVNYRYLLQELDHTNRELAAPASHPCFIPSSDVFIRGRNSPKNIKKLGFENVKSNATCEEQSTASDADSPPDLRKLESPSPKSTASTTPFTPTSASTTPQYLPSYVFDPADEQPSTPPPTTKKPNLSFESVTPARESEENVPSPPPPPTSPPLPMYCFDPQEELIPSEPIILAKQKEAKFEKVNSFNLSDLNADNPKKPTASAGSSPNQMTNPPNSPNQMANPPNSPNQMSNSPNQMANSPNQMANSPNQMSNSPNQMANSPNSPNQITLLPNSPNPPNPSNPPDSPNPPNPLNPPNPSYPRDSPNPPNPLNPPNPSYLPDSPDSLNPLNPPNLPNPPSPPTSTPQTFDLLPPLNSSFSFPLPQPPIASESVRIKQSAPKDNSFDSGDDALSWGFQNLHPTFDFLQRSSALDKLNTGDAAGLQLSLKSRDPWISTLDVAKNFKNFPNSFAPRERLAAHRPPDMETPFAPKRPRSSVALNREYHLAPSPSATYYHRPVFPYRLDKKFFSHKIRPFSKITGIKERIKQQNCQMLPFQYFLRKYPPPFKAKGPPTTHGLDNSDLNSRRNRQRRRRKKKKKKRRRTGGLDRRRKSEVRSSRGGVPRRVSWSRVGGRGARSGLRSERFSVGERRRGVLGRGT